MIYRTIGIVIILTSVVSITLVTTALFASRMSVNRPIVFAGFFAKILDFFYHPLKLLFDKYSTIEQLDKWMVSLKNLVQESDFKKTKRRLLLAPHCMRSRDCPAQSTRFGIECNSCGKCDFQKIKKDLEKFNYTLYIVAGSSYLRHIIKKESAEGALLLACYYELNKSMNALKKNGIITYGIPLLNDGCFDTKINYENLIMEMKKLEYRGKLEE